ncbi:cation-translocating P-type ATPase [Flavihumibacter profundi]|uniref:cation-translocating P-type ATPase n=1 Tax=Flavihumibacter profundi TaxID=2716883 RepID=UPI001CC6B2C2|nr:HAD-IC family P-type ATPase [Flavihumibacter profundi]MBZ5856267.1 HAD-IC family P-type ATPase [Flavihumibacter profundi]
MKAWYQLDIEEIYQLTESGNDGLNTAAILRRQAEFGLNAIPKPRDKSVLAIFAGQFLSPLIYILIAAGLISLVAGESRDALFILIIITINAILGTWQEYKAESSAAALRDLVHIQSRVKRNGKIVQVDAEELVTGDIVLLESGAKVPADLRLISCQDLIIDEALLTGESHAVNKSAEKITYLELSLGDQTNMAFAATTVLKGRATGIVIQTGVQTEIGKIAESLATTTPEKPPLINRMDIFSKNISFAVVLICGLLGLLGYMRGIPAGELFFFMVAVGVSAIPEGLPVALTVALAIGTNRMARRNVIVRKLPAVEGLGSCTLIASDKTGTLTMDQQSVKAIFLPDGKQLQVLGDGYNGIGSIKSEIGKDLDFSNDLLFNFIQCALLSNEGILRQSADGWEYSGDAVDVALRALAYKAGKNPAYFLQEITILQMVPYESENKFSGVFYSQNGQLYFSMKGAVEVVSQYLSETGMAISLNESEIMASNGQRVIALASGPVEKADLSQLGQLNLAGLAGLIDPLRPEAISAIKNCKEAGIEVVMITGDHPLTALTISKQLGIAATKEQLITGKELFALESSHDNRLNEIIANKTVFARVTPMQKKLIIDSKKALGHYVAVTGDGVNDAPALKAAHIGIAMGSGTDLTKDTSSIIITDNNFASIEAGVEEGRNTYNNLRKIIYLLVSTGLAEISLVAIPIISGMPLPFLAVQLLWLNLVTNGIQDVALAFERGDPAVMKVPPRKPGESIFDRQMKLQVFISAGIMTLITFGCWALLLNVWHYEEKHARVIVMMLMVFLQNFHVINCRSETQSIFSTPLGHNQIVIIGITLAQTVHISAAYIPGINDILQLEPITAIEWIILLPTALLILAGMELFKLMISKNKKGPE